MKNSSYNVKGNTEMDRLFVFLDNASFLSENMISKIRGIALWILTNIENHIEEIEEAIKELIEMLRYCTIFSEEFISKIDSMLYHSLKFEANRKFVK